MKFPFKPALLRTFANGYRSSDFLTDLGAGLLVGVVALPLAMAFAIASGTKPEQGLFTAIIAGAVISLLGGSRVQIGGPTGAFVGLCAASVAQYGYGGLAIATIMAGILLLLMGVCRLGKAIEFIPIPVVIGFTSGIAVVIASTQLKDVLGLTYQGSPGEFIERIKLAYENLHQWNHSASILCLATIAVIVVTRRLSPKLPAALIAIIICSVGAWLAGLEVATIESRFGVIPNMLPKPSFPDLGLGNAWSLNDLFNRMYDVRWLAIAIALLGAIESLLSAVVADGMSGDRHDSDTELVAQGVANLVSPFFLGLPATGAIARTATNVRAGARSPIAGLIHAATLLLIMLFAAPLASHIPLPCLAGVLLVVCWNMAELHHWPHILRAKRSDAFLLPTAFLLTVFVDLTVAVIVGTLLAMFLFIKRMADVTKPSQMEFPPGLNGAKMAIKGVEVYEVRGPFFFGVASMIRDILNGVGGKPRILVLHIFNVPFIDGTAVFAIRDLIADCRKRGITLVMSGVHERPYTILKRTHLIDEIGSDRIFSDLDQAFVYCREALEFGTKV
jgi:SulP family sulfate permease